MQTIGTSVNRRCRARPALIVGYSIGNSHLPNSVNKCIYDNYLAHLVKSTKHVIYINENTSKKSQSHFVRQTEAPVAAISRKAVIMSGTPYPIRPTQ